MSRCVRRGRYWVTAGMWLSVVVMARLPEQLLRQGDAEAAVTLLQPVSEKESLSYRALCTLITL